MTDIKLTQGSIYSLTGADIGPLKLTQIAVYGLSQFPASEINVNQVSVYGATSGEDMPVSITEASVYALAKTAYGASKIRTWGFNLDGHNFYVVQIGTLETLVYDMTTEQWSRWTSPGMTTFRPQRGLNWQGFSRDQILGDFTWNIIVGDFQTGNVWIMDPTVGVDDHPLEGTLEFRREVMGMAPQRGRKGTSVHQAYLTLNLGDPQITSADLTLLTSDDAGQTWLDHGAVTVTPADYSQEFSWHGLGLITAPGKLFKIRDEGAAVRISSLDAR